ncbi:MAG: cupin-like domain-containing protein [Burkholderiales bacterium]|nr:cupin-like domain-containing protein [Burkholderiales bacterium]
MRSFVRTWHARPELLDAALLQSTEPVLLRGLAADWPLVQAAKRSDADFCAQLRPYADTRVGLWRAPPAAQGRFFYNEAFNGFNFQRELARFGGLLDELLAGSPDALYLGSTELDGSFPGLRAQHDFPQLATLSGRDPLVSLWLGNRARVAPHFDVPDNVACVVAGRRRFTLFPPEQLPNLYIGPLDLTPAGMPISLVDLSAPDLQRFPRFAQALAQARVFELEPGDALFIPSQWWHGVESLSPINALVNFWWRQSPEFMDTPLHALMLALLTLRDLPPVQRQVWQQVFDHYVFAADEATAAHIPPAARGVLGPLNDPLARSLRAYLLNRLNR